MSTPLRILSVMLFALASLLVAAPAQSATLPVEPYADYQAPKFCRPWAKPGTTFLRRWTVYNFGGSEGGISRACSKPVTSDHMEGRAYDWTLNADKVYDRRRANAFMKKIFAGDRFGNKHVLARRMGIAYIIWNDQIWSSYRDFEPRPYLSSSCKTVKRCNATYRHRDHVHVSLTWQGARQQTSWHIWKTR